MSNDKAMKVSTKKDILKRFNNIGDVTVIVVYHISL